MRGSLSKLKPIHLRTILSGRPAPALVIGRCQRSTTADSKFAEITNGFVSIDDLEDNRTCVATDGRRLHDTRERNRVCGYSTNHASNSMRRKVIAKYWIIYSNYTADRCFT